MKFASQDVETFFDILLLSGEGEAFFIGMACVSEAMMVQYPMI